MDENDWKEGAWEFGKQWKQNKYLYSDKMKLGVGVEFEGNVRFQSLTDSKWNELKYPSTITMNWESIIFIHLNSNVRKVYIHST